MLTTCPTCVLVGVNCNKTNFFYSNFSYGQFFLLAYKNALPSNHGNKTYQGDLNTFTLLPKCKTYRMDIFKT